MNERQKMEQNINVTNSKDVKIIQAGRDVYYQEAKRGKRDVRLPSPIPQAPVDTFFQEKQNTIKELSRKFSTYLNRTPSITEEAIKEWLLQFGNLSWMKLALRLLEKIDYYTPERMQGMFRHFYEQIIPEEDRSNLGEETMKLGIETHPLESILNKMNPEEKVIVFVDDNIGSGKQAVQIFREWLGIEEREIDEHHVIPLSNDQIEKFKQFKIYLCTFVGFEEGKERVREELKKIGLNVE